MRNITSFFRCLLLLHASPTHAQSMEEILPKLAQEKSDSARFYLAFNGLTTSEINPVLDMHNADVLLVHGQMTGEKISQVLGLLCLGYDYREFGSTAKALEYNFNGVAVTEVTGDPRPLGVVRHFIPAEDAKRPEGTGTSAVITPRGLAEEGASKPVFPPVAARYGK